MATSEATVDRPGRERRFEHAGPVAGYVTVMVRLVVEDRFLHAGWGKFGFVAGEPFDAGGYPANADGNRTAGLFAAVAETPLLPGFADVVVPVGEFLIGLGLTLGALTRPAACSAGS